MDELGWSRDGKDRTRVGDHFGRGLLLGHAGLDAEEKGVEVAALFGKGLKEGRAHKVLEVDGQVGDPMLLRLTMQHGLLLRLHGGHVRRRLLLVLMDGLGLLEVVELLLLWLVDREGSQRGGLE